MSSANAGWSTSYANALPWQDALASSAGQQSSLSQTQPSASVSSSASRMLGTSLPAQQQGGTLAQALTGGYSNAPASQASMAQAQPPMSLPTMNRASTYTLNQGTPLGQTAAAAPNAQGSPNLQQYGGQYGGPQVVSVRTNSGNYAYYQFDPRTGQYALGGVYNDQGQALNSGSTTYIGDIPKDANVQQVSGVMGGAVTGTLANGNQFTYSNGRITEYTTTNNLNAAQRAGAQQMALGGGVQVNDTQAGGFAGQVNNAYATARGQYQDQYTKANQGALAASAQAQQSSDVAYILDYMNQHSGALPSVNRPGMSGVPMSQAAFDAAKSQYQPPVQSVLSNAKQLAPIGTAAVDQNGLAALYSLMSQSQTGAFGADAAAQHSALGSAGTYQSGQNLIAHNKDYADKFNVNLGVYNDAVNKQYELDKNATGLQLQQDIMDMSDMLNQLQQAAQQLGSSSQQEVTAQIQALQNQITQYQAAAQQFGANTAHVAGAAQAILSGGGALVAAMTNQKR